MTAYERLLRQLVIANRILARHGVLDAFGHVSARHPEHADRFTMSRSRAPELVVEDDLQTYDLDGTELNGDTRKPYAERFIHAAIYASRPDVQAVCHNHSPSTIPFGTTGVQLKPIFHMAGGIGTDIPVWDIADDFGDSTDMLVTSMDMGRSLARALGPRRVALMRGHGAVVVGGLVPQVVFVAVYLEQNARLATMAEIMGHGQVRYLSEGESAAAVKTLQEPLSSTRAWEAWCAQIGMSDSYAEGE
jgi:ribulose-5-phosphate 4-epimerase/fuculose-1-phosphate aldolase